MEELLLPVLLDIGHNASDMGRICKAAQHVAGKVEQVDLQRLRSISIDEAVDQRLQEGTLTADDLSADSQMASISEIDVEGPLCLLLRIVVETDDRLQMPFTGMTADPQCTVI